MFVALEVHSHLNMLWALASQNVYDHRPGAE